MRTLVLAVLLLAGVCDASAYSCIWVCSTISGTTICQCV
jgi:hypothetical protein